MALQGPLAARQNYNIIKSFLLSKMAYVFSVLPTPQEFIKQLNTIIYNFLWNGPDRIARLAVVNDIKFGGLQFTDIETSIISLRLAWLERIYSSGRIPWKAFLDYLLKNYGGTSTEIIHKLRL